MAQELNFTFRMNFPEKHVYSLFENGVWHGIIGEVHERLYDFSISDLSVTQQRSEVTQKLRLFSQLFEIIVYTLISVG